MTDRHGSTARARRRARVVRAVRRASRPTRATATPTADLEFLLERRLGQLHRRTRSTRSTCVDGRLRCELLNRHDTHTQTLMPMSGDAIVVVAPADVDFSDAAHFDTVRAFVMPRHTLRASAPRHLALGPVPARRADRVRIFNIQGRGYAERQRHRALCPGSRPRLRSENEVGLKFLKLSARSLDQCHDGAD